MKEVLAKGRRPTKQQRLGISQVKLHCGLVTISSCTATKRNPPIYTKTKTGNLKNVDKKNSSTVLMTLLNVDEGNNNGVFCRTTIK